MTLDHSVLPHHRKRSLIETRRACPVSSAIPVLLVSSRESDAVEIGKLRPTPYMIVNAVHKYQAASLFSNVVFPIVLIDRLFDGPDWHLHVAAIIGAWSIPTVLLLSDYSNETLLEESIARGAFDVLVRPLEPTLLISTLDFAYTNWKLGLTQRPALHSNPRTAVADSSK